MRTLYIETRRIGILDTEAALMASEGAKRGFHIVISSWKPFLRHRITPKPGDVVSGSIRFVRAALQAIGQELPHQTPYPISLMPWLRRKVWCGLTLGTALKELNGPTFIRPAKRWKLFQGLVIDGPNPPELVGISRREPVWCAEPVAFLSEYRVYRLRASARSFVARCPGTESGSPAPRMDQVLAALHAFEAAGSPCAYAIDFGVLSTGETVLVEVNDGFSVGAYDNVPADVYFEMTAQRWAEMTLTAPRDTSIIRP